MKYVGMLVTMVLMACGSVAEPVATDAGRDAGADSGDAATCGPIPDPSGQCDWIDTCNGLCGHADAGRD